MQTWVPVNFCPWLNGEGRIQHELLNQEQLAILDAELQAYDADLISKGLQPSKSGRKKKEKEIRTRLLKEMKLQHKEISVKSQSTPSEPVSIVNPLQSAPLINLSECAQYLNIPIKVQGWIKHLRRQGKNLIFADLRRRMDTLQCVITGPLVHSKEAAQLTRECCVIFYGILHEEPRAGNNVELSVSFITILGQSPIDLEERLNAQTNPEQRLNNRHLDLRRESMAALFSLRGKMMSAIHRFFLSHHFSEVTAPTIIKTPFGGRTQLFHVDYYGQEAFLSEGAQFYMEAILPVLDRVYCVLPTFRADRSMTSRHLSESTHLEVEMAFCSHTELMDMIEELFVFLTTNLAVEAWFKIWNKEHPDTPINHFATGKEFEYGDEIPEKPLRMMLDALGAPVIVHSHPKEMKSYYVKLSSSNPDEVESVDLLFPTLGKVVGGSSRVHSLEELQARTKECGDGSPLAWYADLRKYGSCPHAGFGVVVERFLFWIANLSHMRDTSMFPRMIGRLSP
ncbi:putative Asparagine--tRNA ligase [Blattamonas nauphoetae]|uniref:asparagine--tRNA ligase n=1 Tax=Blattamonas nauphoetae TaxID=2049346 RepID=A0ABQ9Y2M4_9EUKA|nr:putative Asparagine--tRNA ligase [Blattamonas nauphoetae]